MAAETENGPNWRPGSTCTKWTKLLDEVRPDSTSVFRNDGMASPGTPSPDLRDENELDGWNEYLPNGNVPVAGSTLSPGQRSPEVLSAVSDDDYGEDGEHGEPQAYRSGECTPVGVTDAMEDAVMHDDASEFRGTDLARVLGQTGLQTPAAVMREYEVVPGIALDANCLFKSIAKGIGDLGMGIKDTPAGMRKRLSEFMQESRDLTLRRSILQAFIVKESQSTSLAKARQTKLENVQALVASQQWDTPLADDVVAAYAKTILKPGVAWGGEPELHAAALHFGVAFQVLESGPDGDWGATCYGCDHSSVVVLQVTLKYVKRTSQLHYQLMKRKLPSRAPSPPPADTDVDIAADSEEDEDDGYVEPSPSIRNAIRNAHEEQDRIDDEWNKRFQHLKMASPPRPVALPPESPFSFATCSVANFVACSVANVVACSVADVVACSVANVVACSVADVVACSVANVVACSVANVVACSVANVVACSVANVVACSVANVRRALRRQRRPRAPSPTSSRALSPTSSRAPSPTSSRAPSPTSSRAPSPTSSRAPSPTSSRAPSPTSSRALSPTSSRAPSPSSSRAPSPSSSRAPSPSSPRIPRAASPAPKSPGAPSPRDTSPRSPHSELTTASSVAGATSIACAQH